MTKVHFPTAFQHLQVSLEMFQLPSLPWHHSLFIHYLLLKAYLVFHSKEMNAM